MKTKIIILTLLSLLIPSAFCQSFSQNLGDGLPDELEDVYLKGLQYLSKTQKPNGSWGNSNGAGITSLCILSFLAHGDDPNFSRYAPHLKKAIKYLLIQQNKQNGILGHSMYNHAYATLALAESYGTIMNPKIGPALEKAVGALLQSQKNNPLGAWRYSANSSDADTSAAGACIVALLAAKNAGLAVPQESIDKGLAYFKKCQADNGSISYTAGNSRGNTSLSSMGVLVYGVGRHRSNAVYKKALEYIRDQKNSDGAGEHSYSYMLYYQSQAYFQSDMDLWWSWNKKQVSKTLKIQSPDGSIPFQDHNGLDFSTSMSLLALALNYRYLPIYER